MKLDNSKKLALATYSKLMRASEGVTSRMHKHLAEEKLTISQFGVLEALFHLGPMFQWKIGKKILKTSGNITMVVVNLENRDLVRRETDPNDRRRTKVALTSKGEALIKRIFPRHAEISEQIFSVLNKTDLRQLGSLLKKLGKAQR